MVKARKMYKEKLTVIMIAYIFLSHENRSESWTCRMFCLWRREHEAVSSCNWSASCSHLITNSVDHQFIAYHNMTDRPMTIAILMMSKWLSCNISKTILGYFNTCDWEFIEYETRKKCKQLCLLLAIIQ